jgi:hypothetical protein
MRKKIKKIATGSIVGTLLFVSSGTVRAQNSPLVAKTSQGNEVVDSEVLQEENSNIEYGVGVSAYDNVQGESRDMLLEQGFSPAQIQKLNHWN